MYKKVILRFTVDGEPLITNISLKCTRSKCDDCEIRFHCFTTKMDEDEDEISIEINEALKMFEGYDHKYLVWRDSRCKMIDGELREEAKGWLKDFGEMHESDIKKGVVRLPPNIGQSPLI